MKAFVMILSLLFLPQAAFSQTPPAPPAPPAPVATPTPTPQGPGTVEVVKPEDLAKAEAPTAPKQEQKKEETTPGAIVYVRPYPADGGSLSEADYGAFQSTEFSYDSGQFTGKGVKTGSNQYCIEVQTYLVAKEAGLYQIAIDTKYDGKSFPTKTMFSTINLEGTALVNDVKKSGVISMGPVDNRTVGAAKLSPGIYKLQVIAGIETNNMGKDVRFGYSLLIKGPGDLSFRAPKSDELVLKK